MTTISQVSFEIAHGGIVDARHGSGLSSPDPGNIAIELIAAPT